jgi:hypothetical protein
MSGFPKKAPQAAKPSSRSEPLFELPTVVKMIPLVQRIAADLLSTQVELSKYHTEAVQLDRQRRDLSWPERRRRYMVHDSISSAENRIRAYIVELESLGVAVVDLTTAQLGFPTIVNNKLAFFSWLPNEESIGFWHYDHEVNRRRPVPEAWFKPLPRSNAIRSTQRSRPGVQIGCRGGCVFGPDDNVAPDTTFGTFEKSSHNRLRRQ